MEATNKEYNNFKQQEIFKVVKRTVSLNVIPII